MHQFWSEKNDKHFSETSKSMYSQLRAERRQGKQFHSKDEGLVNFIPMNFIKIVFFSPFFFKRTAHRQIHKNKKFILLSIHSFKCRAHIVKTKTLIYIYIHVIYKPQWRCMTWNLILCIDAELFLYLRWKTQRKLCPPNITNTVGFGALNYTSKVTVTCVWMVTGTSGTKFPVKYWQ